MSRNGFTQQHYDEMNASETQAEIDAWKCCKDCGLSKEQTRCSEERCSLCQRAWDEKMRELGGGE